MVEKIVLLISLIIPCVFGSTSRFIPDNVMDTIVGDEGVRGPSGPTPPGAVGFDEHLNPCYPHPNTGEIMCIDYWGTSIIQVGNETIPLMADFDPTNIKIYARNISVVVNLK
jgi:hypothetical protein